jgi:Site-specific DNA methylase
MSDIDFTDMFCGAGGSSTGLSEVPGVTVKLAMNHWARAIETHNTNHPDVDHLCANISVTDPRSIPTTVGLWGSPECTNHSVAKGRKRITNQGALFGDKAPDEAATRSRATMWDIPAYAEIHDYKIIITENVVDAARWVMFDAWLAAMKALGYEHHIVYMNSMHAQLGGAPAPQSRDRMYVMFWKKGNKRPDFDRLRPMAYCPSCDETVRALQVFKKNERWGRYKAQYVYRCPKATCRNRIIEPGWRPASDAIDWSIQGQRIGDRDKPLAAKTMARIEAGLAKYGPGSLHLEAAGNTYDSATTGEGDYYRIWPTSEPYRTLHTTASKGLVIDAVRGADIISDVSEPFRTQTTSYTRGLLIPVEGRDGKDAQRIEQALRTQTTRNETALLMPYYGTGVTAPVTRPINTLTATDRYAMITLRGTNAPKDVRDPFDTFAANGNHHGLMGVVPKVEDCTFRMLEPHEVTWGMAFPKTYTMTGTKREQVKQAGNAVCPPNARDLGLIAAESLN